MGWVPAFEHGVGAQCVRGDAAPHDLDPAAFHETYLRYRSMVISLLRHYLDAGDVEDAAQEVFAEAWRAWERFDPVRFSLHGWLVGIARHVALDRQSAVHRHRVVEGRMRDTMTLGTPWVRRPEQAEAAEIRALVMRLSTRNRRIIVMRFVLGYSRSEIGTALGMTESAVAKRILRTLRFLRVEMGTMEAGAAGGAAPERSGAADGEIPERICRGNVSTSA